MDWGWISEAGLRQAGYPESLLVSAPTSAKYGPQGMIYGSYVYDEENFAAFLPWFERTHPLREAIARHELGFWPGLWALYRSAYVPGHLSFNPVAPMGFAAFTAVLATRFFGLPIDSPESWKTIFFRFGRWVTVLLALPALLVFLGLWRHFTGMAHPAWLGAGAFAFLFHPLLLTHGRFITYNIAMVAMELGLMLWVARITRAERPQGHSAWQAAIAGMALGLGLATKLTIAPVGLCVGAVLLHQGYTEWRRSQKAFAACLPSLAYAVSALAVSLFFFAPALMNAGGAEGLANQKRMLLGLADLHTGTPVTRAWAYFAHTLPAAMGWPLYATGAAGLIGLLCRLRFSRSGGWSGWTPSQSLWVAVTLAFFTLYPSNALGLEVQRAQTVTCLWFLFAGWALSQAYRQVFHRGAWRIAWTGWGVYLGLALLFGAFSTTWFFCSDRPGYRQAMAEWTLQHVPAGDTIWIDRQDPSTLSHLSRVEWDKPVTKSSLYHWEIHDEAEFRDRKPKAWGQYHAVCDCGERVAVFRSPVKDEAEWHRGLRMLFGWHRWDQLVNQPDFALFKTPSPR